MTLNDLRAYLNNNAMLTTDKVVIKTADGTEHAILTITRDNGSSEVYPTPNAQQPEVIIQLA